MPSRLRCDGAYSKSETQRAAEGGVVPDGMTVSVSVIGVERELHPNIRNELYRIGNEAIQNAEAHSHGSRLSIDLT